jgi:hypothetical protein
MPIRETPLPETVERYCPVCRNAQITPVGHVIAGDGLIKAQHRCDACGAAFRFVRKPLS